MRKHKLCPPDDYSAVNVARCGCLFIVVFWPLLCLFVLWIAKP